MIWRFRNFAFSIFMIKNFRTYEAANEFHWSCEKIAAPPYLKDQLLRASSSIVLNLAEGSAKPTVKDRKRFYFTAFGSLRECQAILKLLRVPRTDDSLARADALGAQLYKLCKAV